MTATAQTSNRIGHKAPVSCTAASRDGRFVASGSYDATIRIWDPQKRALVRTLSASSLVNGVAFSPDGTKIASGECDYAAYIRDIESGKILQSFHGHEDDVNAISWSPDGKYLATASFDDTARIWDSNTGKCLRVLQGHDDDVNGVFWSPNGQLLATASDDHTVRIWDFASGTLRTTLHGAEDWCDHAHFSPDGARIACSSMDGRARIFRVSDGELLLTLAQHGSSVKALCWTHDGTRICTASYDHYLREFDAETGLLTNEVIDSTMWSRFVSEIGTTGRYVTGSFDGAPLIWDPASGAQEIVVAPTHGINAASISPDEKLVATPCDDGVTRIFDLESGDLLQILHGHSGPPICAAFSPQGDLLATGSWDNSVAVFRTSDWQLVTRIRGISDIVCALVFSHDGKEIVTANYSGAVVRWDAQSGQLLGVLTLHQGSAKGLCRGPEDSYLSGGRDGEVHRSRACGEVERWPVANTILNAVALDRDARRYATAARNHSVCVFDAKTGKKLHSFADHPCSVKTVSWSCDDQTVFAGYYDGAVLVWNIDVNDARVISPVEGHAVSQVSALHSGQLVIGSWNSRGTVSITQTNGKLVKKISALR